MGCSLAQTCRERKKDITVPSGRLSCSLGGGGGEITPVKTKNKNKTKQTKLTNKNQCIVLILGDYEIMKDIMSLRAQQPQQ